MDFIAATYSSTTSTVDAASVANGIIALYIFILLAVCFICGFISYSFGKKYGKATWFLYGFFFLVFGIIIAAIRSVEFKLDSMNVVTKTNRSVQNSSKNSHAQRVATKIEEPEEIEEVEDAVEVKEDFDDGL